MFDYTIINIVTGLIFIFLLYSLLATAIQEAIANMLQRRSNMLQYGIKCMLTKTINNSNRSKVALIGYHIWKSLVSWGKGLKSIFVKRKMEKVHEIFYNHPIIKNYGQNSLFSKPSYLGAENFSIILIDTIKNFDARYRSVAVDFNMIKTIIGSFTTEVDKGDAYAYTPELPDGTKAAVTAATPRIDKETLQILNLHLNEAGGDLDVFRSRLEKWFNDTMDRVTGWYKKNTHYWLFCIGMFLAVTLNIDTIEISNYLSENKVAAEHLAKMGEAAITSNDPRYKATDSTIAQEALDSIKKDIREVNTLIGLGWGDYGRSDNAFVCELQGREWHNKWYLFWYPFYCIPLDTFATNKGRIDSMNRVYAKKISDLSDSLAADKSRLAAKATRRDTIKQAQDSIAYKSVVKERQFVVDSLRYRVLYDKVYATYPIRTQITYILSKRSWHKFFGFFITAIAIGLGAPFWYDMLNKIVSVRSAGKVRSTSTATSSSDNKEQADG